MGRGGEKTKPIPSGHSMSVGIAGLIKANLCIALKQA